MKRRLSGARLALAAGIAFLTAAALSGVPAALATAASAGAPASSPHPAVTTASQQVNPRGLSTLGSSGWEVLTSKTATQGGAAISKPGFNTSSWLSVTPDDGGAPGTEIEALVQNGACPNVYYSTNMKTCFGYLKAPGANTLAEFDVPWWYRTDFTANLVSGQTATLIVNGVIGAADVWVNGKEVATKSTVTGAYDKFTFNVGSLLTAGTNSLALEVYPNNPLTELTVDNVDWTQVPPDENTGIQFPIQLQVADTLSVGNAHVVENNAANLSSSALTVKTDVTNGSASSQTGTVFATVTPPDGGSPITVSKNVTVAANSTKTVSFTPSGFPALTISTPQVWWPYQMGAQPLYALDTTVTQGSAASNSTHETFGIRTVTSSLVGKSSEAPSGVRQFQINGVPIVIRGGGFEPDLLLHYSSADIARQIAILKNMGLNTLRLEGHFMPDDFYEQMDAAGIMIDSGYSCCDAWENASPNAATLALMTNSAVAIGQAQRNHPSVIAMGWSDNAPGKAQESAAITAWQNNDFDVPVLASAEYNSGAVSGPSGQKEGPYDYVPPLYWYDTTHYDSSDDTRTNVGGSWGLDSEESAGDTVPTLDSINRFMSATDQADLWQNPSFNQYHANYENGHGNYQFGTLYLFDQALTNRYGAWNSLDSYVEEAQIQEYESTRAQFEAFMDHSTNTPTPATGTIYWQANKGWPTLLWALYNEDGDQAGSFFGAKQANQSLHALLAQDTNKVTLDNVSGASQSGLSIESKVYNTAGTVLDDQTVSGITLTSQQVRTGVITPKEPTSTTGNVYFVELLLKQNGNLVDRDVYWQSTKQDVINWSSTLGNPNGTESSYADLTGLKSLAPATVSATATATAKPGPDGADTSATVTITNTSTKPTVGFFLRADVRRGNADGSEQSGDNQVTSALWSDNDITLWPGESQTLTVTYDSADLDGATPLVSVFGSNVTKFDVVVGGSAGAGHGSSATAGANSLARNGSGLVDAVEPAGKN
ncbi:MAG TPA: beta-mannosidase [Pseudonocardiaceae bacterium]|jgi:exo-1,4-beta-D-glucosaminidase|nr:beta-mannosidase [Pseudonocardiaceae bacterium]